MNIDIKVRDRQISTQSSILIPAGSSNDAFVRFIFDPGYGWEGLEISAVFTRTDMIAYRTHIQHDTYTPIPTNILSRPGVFFVSLLGCKGTNTVATTQTLAFTVENNAMNILRPTPYPVNEDGDYDSDAYAQYINLVTDAINRAEAAAKYIEENAVGYYSKTESDDRYMRRFILKTVVERELDTSNIVAGDVPEITLPALEVDTPIGSLDQPVAVYPIETIRVNVVDSMNTESNFGYSGFAMYKLGSVCDELKIDKNGAILTKRIHNVKLGDLEGTWTNDTTYVASLVTTLELDEVNKDLIFTNVGPVITSAENNKLTFTFPKHLTSEELANIEILYPIATEYTKLISYIPSPTISNSLKLRVYYTKNQVEYPANLFYVSAEFNLQKYLNTITDGHQEIAIAKLQEQVDILKNEVTAYNNTQVYTGPKYSENKESWKEDTENNLLGLQVNSLIIPLNVLGLSDTNEYKQIVYTKMEKIDASCILWFDADTIKELGNIYIVATSMD